VKEKKRRNYQTRSGKKKREKKIQAGRRKTPNAEDGPGYFH